MFDRLRQLEANATPGPWAWSNGLWPETRVRRLKSQSATYPKYPGAKVGVLKALDYVAEDDAAFLVAARNLWGPLVAVAEAMRDIRDSDESDLGTFSEFVGAVATESLAALERAVKEQP